MFALQVDFFFSCKICTWCFIFDGVQTKESKVISIYIVNYFIEKWNGEITFINKFNNMKLSLFVYHDIKG